MKTFVKIKIAGWVGCSVYAISAFAGESAPSSVVTTSLFSSYVAVKRLKATCGNYDWMEIESETNDPKGVVTKRIEKRYLVDSITQKEFVLNEVVERRDSREVPETFQLSEVLNSAGYRLVLSSVMGSYGPETLYYLRDDGGVHPASSRRPSVAKGLCIALDSVVKSEK